VNFDQFGHAAIILFRTGTGENWNTIMHDLALVYPVFGYVYSLSFVIIVSLLVINLIVAIIIREMEADTVARAKGLSSKVTVAALRSFGTAWADVRFDYDEYLAHKGDAVEQAAVMSPMQVASSLMADSEHSEKMLLPATELPNLILKLPPPLGLAHQVGITRAHVMRVIRELDIPTDDQGRIEFRVTLKMLINHIVLGDVINKVIAENSLTPESAPSDKSMHGVAAASPVQQQQQQQKAISDELKALLDMRARNKVEVHDVRADEATTATEKIARELMRQQVRRFLKRKARQQERVLSSRRLHAATGAGGSARVMNAAVAVVPLDSDAVADTVSE